MIVDQDHRSRYADPVGHILEVVDQRAAQQASDAYTLGTVESVDPLTVRTSNGNRITAPFVPLASATPTPGARCLVIWVQNGQDAAIVC